MFDLLPTTWSSISVWTAYKAPAALGIVRWPILFCSLGPSCFLSGTGRRRRPPGENVLLDPTALALPLLQVMNLVNKQGGRISTVELRFPTPFAALRPDSVLAAGVQALRLRQSHTLRPIPLASLIAARREFENSVGSQFKS